MLNVAFKQFEKSVTAVGEAICKMTETQVENSRLIHESLLSLETMVQEQALQAPRVVKRQGLSQ